MTITELRKELGVTLDDFAPMIGLASKGQASQIARGAIAPSIKVAIKLENLSGGRIKASSLNEDVALIEAHLKQQAA